VRDNLSHDLLGQLLQVTTKLESRDPDPALIRRVLEFGCDPNARLGKRPSWWDQRYPFSEASVTMYTRLYWCFRTTWQAWLGETYLLTQQQTNAETPGQISSLLEERKVWIGVLVDLLLRYGADPHATICVTDHEKEPYSKVGVACNHVTFERLLQHIAPAESLMQLQDLRILCCDSRISHTLRKNQRSRAIRSLLTSKQNRLTGSPVYPMPMPTNEDLWVAFLYSSKGAVILAVEYDCNECGSKNGVLAPRATLVTWCVECQSLSYFCLECSQLRPDEAPDLTFSCNRSVVAFPSRDEGHASVVFVWEHPLFGYDDSETARTKDYADFLHERYPIDHAITFLKDWYSKNPIEPDLTFEEAIRDVTTLPVPFQPYQSY
jgi:hypothetical protein